jgi:hypothetical protein
MMLHKRADSRGYIRVYGIPGGWQYEHRLAAEAALGRPLGKKEVVHHKNEDRGDNRPSNLEVMRMGKHIALHNSLNPKRRRQHAAEVAA